MKRLLIMLAVLLACFGAFYIYVSTQTVPVNPVTTERQLTPQDMRKDADTVGDVGPGARPWVKVYDKERRLSYRFRAREYSPERAGQIHVADPEAEFFQYVRDEKAANGIRTQRIQLVGKSGEVEIQQGPQASADKGFNKGSSGPPKRGLLSDVVIRMFHKYDDPEPAMTITAPNVSFDNETYEIATRGYTNADGVYVPPDQVPILATGDYEFSGRGLTLRWNDVDGRLEHLEIAHGDYLHLKNLDALNKRSKQPATSPASGQTAEGSTAMPIADAQDVPVILADASTQGVGKLGKSGLPKTRPTRPKKPSQPPYRASFDRDVRIFEGDINVAETELARADVMYIDFLAGSAEKPAKRPTTAPATTQASTEATQPALPDGKVAMPASKPAATQPVQKPIIVRWTGKLRVVPLEGSADLPTPLQPGESVLRFFGQASPVRLVRGLNRVDCTAADYFSSDDSVMVRGSDRHGPVVLRQAPDPLLPPDQARQATIVTQALNYSGKDKVATLNGKSHATITLPHEPATRPAVATTQRGDPQTLITATAERPPQVVTAAWTREGKLYFKNGMSGEMTFDQARFTGDVEVNHPQLALKSHQLAMLFEERVKPTTRPAAGGKPDNQLVLKQVVATSDVWADLIGADGQMQTVIADQLTVDTASDASGKLYPRLITATGNANAFDEKQSLRAGGVELTMAPVATPAAQPSTAKTRPTTAPAVGNIQTAEVELKSMRAWDGVVLTSADGATAAGDAMTVNVVAGHALARLTGNPMAAVTDAKGSTIVGPVIDIDPKRSWAKVTGRGSIRAVQAEDEPKAGDPATQPAVAATRPVKQPKFLDIVWETKAEMDGATDRIVVEGPVLVSSTDPDGTMNTARGLRAIIELAKKPVAATQPTRSATKPAQVAATKPSKRSDKAAGIAGLAGGDGMDLFKDKAVSAINLEEDAVVNSTLSDENGILRQFELKAPMVRYETGSQAATARSAPETPTGAPLALGSSGNGRLIVPVPGTMIYRDHRPATRPATKPANTASGSDQARGATAFRWNESLIYDQAKRQATMTGQVMIVHQPDGAEAKVQVTGDQAIASFEPKPATRPAGAKPADETAIAMQLKRLTIAGNLAVIRGASQMTATRMDYDPATGWMVAVGTRQNPATYTEATGQRTIWADEVHWNAQTWLTKIIGGRGSAGGAGLGSR